MWSWGLRDWGTGNIRRFHCLNVHEFPLISVVSLLFLCILVSSFDLCGFPPLSTNLTEYVICSTNLYANGKMKPLIPVNPDSV